MLTTGSAADRIRVVHLSPGLDQGGLEKLQVEYARHSDRSRFDVRFVALGDGGRNVAEIEKQGWPVEILGKPPGLRPLKILQLARYLRRHRVEVLHTHNHGPVFYGAPAGRLAGVPVIVHTRHHGRNHVFKPREIRLTTAATRLVDRVVCVSEDSATQGRIDQISPKKLMTIRNGIDITRFAFRGPDASGPAVVVARLQPEKSIETLVQALPHVLRSIPNYRVEIAGDGRCRGDLEKLASELGVSDHVVFHGNVDDVPALLARASVMILPSLTEGISLTLLEAMARGLPVITTRVGGNPEVVVEGKTGYLVPPAHPESLAQAMVQLHHDPEQGRVMGAEGRRRVEQDFDIRRMVREYEALYVELLKRARPRRDFRVLKSTVEKSHTDDSALIEAPLVSAR